jgi:hypothetical protein
VGFFVINVRSDYFLPSTTVESTLTESFGATTAESTFNESTQVESQFEVLVSWLVQATKADIITKLKMTFFIM